MSTPLFERNEDHEWRLDEKVYVLDESRYDIFEAIIVAVYEDGYDVHYPEWPDDDETVEADRLVQITDKNTAIFIEQEKIRARKEKALEAKKRSKKEKKEPKPKKEKKEPKEPKPKKEKKEPKPKKEKKEMKEKKETKSEKKTSKSKALSDDVILRRALVAIQSVDGDEFDSWFDKNYGAEPSVQDRRAIIKERFLAREFDNVGNFSESDYSDNSEIEEEISYNNPEIIKLTPQDQEHVDGSCLRLPGSLSFAHPDDSEVKETDMRIMFDRDDFANCFIYKTADAEYLILNGMKWKIKHDKDMYIDQSELLEESPVIGIENQQSSAALYPALHIVDPVHVLPPPEYDEYLMLVQKDKKKVDLDNLEDDYSD